MEPRQAGPGMSFEQMPEPPRSAEGYNFPQGNPEQGQERDVERANERPALREREAVVPVVPVLPTPLPQVDDTAAPAAASSIVVSVPDVAADEDLIEKEWVDKAKKIIEDTKDDPFRREQEIGKLQREYIRKRYGREIGEPGS